MTFSGQPKPQITPTARTCQQLSHSRPSSGYQGVPPFPRLASPTSTSGGRYIISIKETRQQWLAAAAASTCTCYMLHTRILLTTVQCIIKTINWLLLSHAFFPQYQPSEQWSMDHLCCSIYNHRPTWTKVSVFDYL